MDRLSALWRSLDELIPYAASRGMRLRLENRPMSKVLNFEDLGEILFWYADDAVGYWHDTGHAQVQEALGFTPQAEWLRACGHWLIGAHLHDEAYLEVHLASGEGAVDWHGLAPLMPADVLRVIETNHAVSTESLCAGIEYLKMTGWIKE